MMTKILDPEPCPTPYTCASERRSTFCCASHCAQVETAINIGYACSLLTNDQNRLVITSETPDIVEAEHRDGADLEAVVEREVLRQLHEAVAAAEEGKAGSHPADLACIVDGKALQVLLRPANKGELLRLGMQCKARVARHCRQENAAWQPTS